MAMGMPLFMEVIVKLYPTAREQSVSSPATYLIQIMMGLKNCNSYKKFNTYSKGNNKRIGTWPVALKMSRKTRMLIKLSLDPYILKSALKTKRRIKMDTMIFRMSMAMLGSSLTG